MVSASSRRVSYVIPPPAEPVPHLVLPGLDEPRGGRIAPLIVPTTPPSWAPPPPAGAQLHPRHRLAVSSLALDASTRLLGRTAPEGILYTGGRDGLIISWDLDMRMRTRRPAPEDGFGTNKPKRWEAITGWDDELDEDEDEPVLAGDVIGDVTKSRRSDALPDGEIFPWEDQWEACEQGPMDNPATFRQSVQAHTDWVNDLLLCNYNQTIVSASADGTVKAWNPHSSQDLAVVGQHADYVKCLTHSRTQSWIASGSFDRTIKLWDISRATSTSAPAKPLTTLTAPETATDLKASVYALASDHSGQVIASGSPERIVRMWDPRSGKSTGKLVGHTDNIRALIVSADGRWLLSAGADASVKLWSLASPQRCLHTFSHHISSVWSLSSLHPQLSTFYSGDRDGLLCRVDVGAADDISDGECVVLAREPGGVCAIAPVYASPNENADGNGGRVYAASGSSSVHCWRDIQPRRTRLEAPILHNEAVGSPTSEEPVTPPAHGMSSGYVFPRPRQGVAFNNQGGLDRHGSNASTATAHAHSTGHSLSISSLADLVDTPGRHTAHRSPSPAVSNTHSLHADVSDVTPDVCGIPVDTLVRLGPPTDSFGGGFPGMYSGTVHSPAHAGRKDTDAATLYSAASIHSLPPRAPTQFSPHAHSFSLSIPAHHGTADERSPLVAYLAREIAAEARPLRAQPLDTISGSPAPGIVRSVLLNDRIHALTVDTTGEVRIWDVVRCLCKGVFVDEQRAAGISIHADDDIKNRKTPFSISAKSPREALEEVRERIEGDVVANAWATVDTRIGELTVHMVEGRCFEAEVYADEAGYGSERSFEDDSRLNIGKWVLSNLFAAFVREQIQRLTSGPLSSSAIPHETSSLSRDFSQRLTFAHDNHRARTLTDVTAPGLAAGSLPTPGFGITNVTNPVMTPAILPDGATTPVPIPLPKDQKPVPTVHLSSVPEGSAAVLSSSPVSAATLTGRKLDAHSDYFAKGKTDGEDFSGWTGPGKGLSSNKDKEEAHVPQTPTSSSGGLMGRLKLFARQGSKRPLSGEGQNAASKDHAADAAAKDAAPEVDVPFNFASTLPSPLALPTANDAPPLYLPLHTGLMISEETSETASGWDILYRGSVGNTAQQEDLHILERAMPHWLVDYLFAGRIPPESHRIATGVKLSFVLVPWQVPNSEDALPKVMDPNARLTASRFLRVRKVANYVGDTLKSSHTVLTRTTTRASAEATSASPPSTSSLPTQSHLPAVQGEAPTSSTDENAEPPSLPVASSGAPYELLVHDIVLPEEMTLAAVRQFVWKQGGDLVLQYRLKPPAVSHLV